MDVPLAVDDTWLTREGRHLHGCLFGEEPPGEWLAQYIRAHGALAALSSAPALEADTARVIVERALDVAGIEPWLRRKEGGRHLVCRKVVLALHLAECDGAHPFFYPRARAGISLPAAVWSLFWLGVRSAWQLAAGRLAIRKYGLR